MDRFPIPKPEIEELFYLELKQTGDVAVDGIDNGEVLLSPIVGGTFEGEKLRGTVAPMGMQYCHEADNLKNWLTATVLLNTDDGAQIIMKYSGYGFMTQEQQDLMIAGEFVDPADYYYKYNLEFKTADERYKWLEGKCCFAVIGVKDWETVCYDAYMIK